MYLKCFEIMWETIERFPIVYLYSTQILALLKQLCTIILLMSNWVLHSEEILLQPF